MSKRANLSFRPIAAMAAALLICTFWTNAHAQETCERAGIEFGFFNGVQTIFDDAQEVVDRFLPEQYGRTTPDGQPIGYTLYYNDTEGWADFVETFEQRLQEHNGVLSQRFELFFLVLAGGRKLVDSHHLDRADGAQPVQPSAGLNLIWVMNHKVNTCSSF